MGIFLTFICIIIFHCLWKIIHYVAKEGKCSDAIIFVGKLLTYALYIRLIILSFQFSLMTNGTEAYEVNLTSNKRNFSTLIAFFGIFFQFGLLLFIYFVGKTVARQELSEEESSLSEITSGTKNGTFAKHSLFFNLSRIFISVSLVLYAVNLSENTKIWIFLVIQVTFSLLKLIIRPYLHIHVNIIEILNDLIYILLCGIIYNNSTIEWKSSTINIFKAVIKYN